MITKADETGKLMILSNFRFSLSLSALEAIWPTPNVPTWSSWTGRQSSNTECIFITNSWKRSICWATRGISTATSRHRVSYTKKRNLIGKTSTLNLWTLKPFLTSLFSAISQTPSSSGTSAPGNLRSSVSQFATTIISKRTKSSGIAPSCTRWPSPFCLSRPGSWTRSHPCRNTIQLDTKNWPGSRGAQPNWCNSLGSKSRLSSWA